MALEPQTVNELLNHKQNICTQKKKKKKKKKKTTMKKKMKK